MNEQAVPAEEAHVNPKVATAELTKFLEDTPLYVKLRLRLPPVFESVRAEVLELTCPLCKLERPFRGEARVPAYLGTEFPPARRTGISGVRHIKFGCTGCETAGYEYWLYVNYEGEHWIQKVGQLPIWIPTISKEMEKELGEDAEIYKKALRNMNEGYGIGACAYLRR